MRSALLLTGCLVLGCGKRADDPGAEKPTESGKATTDLAKPDPGKSAPNTPVEPTTKSAGGCEAAVKHVYDLMAKSGDGALIAQVSDQAIADDIAACTSESWPAKLLACSMESTTVKQVADKCNKLAFEGDLELKAGREFDGAADNGAADPPVYKLDGDMVIFNQKARCGVLKKHRYGADAMFVMCGPKVIAGPLTTVVEIEGVMAEIRAQSADAHKLMISIMNNYPTGCSTCRYKVYDKDGTLIREE